MKALLVGLGAPALVLTAMLLIFMVLGEISAWLDDMRQARARRRRDKTNG